MDSATLRTLIEEFTSLQAAHRALAHSVHPSALAPVREQSRELLIQLRALSSNDNDPADAVPSQETLEQIRDTLKEQASRTLAILEGIEFSQLRASIPGLAQQHPDEVCGLIDILLTGNIGGDKSLRALEYLITMLSTKEQGGRRVVIREASQVTSRLRKAGSQRMKENEEQCIAAERFIEDAMLDLLKDGELGEIRDRVRAFKEELGGNVLQPQVLAAAVAYNAAMWNRVATEIDNSRSIELLTEELLAPGPNADSSVASATDTAPEVVGSETFRRLVEAVAARIAGGESSDKLASQAAGCLALESIRGQDADVFEGDDSSEADWLMRVAVTVGLVLKHRSEVEDISAAMGLDLESLAKHGVEDLVAHISAVSRKLFAASNYGDAFRLSDIKTHCLSPHSVTDQDAKTLAGPAPENQKYRRRKTDPLPGAAGWLKHLRNGMPSWPVLLVGLGLLAIFLALPTKTPIDAASQRIALNAISPFLAAGQHLPTANPPRFVGTLGSAWDYLGTPERAEATSEIGRHFASLGTHHVMLSNQRNQVVAEFRDGKLMLLLPRPTPQLEEQ